MLGLGREIHNAVECFVGMSLGIMGSKDSGWIFSALANMRRKSHRVAEIRVIVDLLTVGSNLRRSVSVRLPNGSET